MSASLLSISNSARICNLPNGFLEALSNAVLAGTSIYCLYEIFQENFFCPHITYILIAINNVVAILWWATNFNCRIFEILTTTSYYQFLFALPCITTQVWLQSDFTKEASWSWVVVAFLPLLYRFVYGYDDTDLILVEFMILANLIGLGYASFLTHSNEGIAATICYALAHCYVRQRPLYNYSMCLFSYLSLRSLGFGKMCFK